MSSEHIACSSVPLSSWYSIPGWTNCMTPDLSNMNVTEVAGRLGPVSHQSFRVPVRHFQSIATGKLKSLASTTLCTRWMSSGSSLPSFGWNTPINVRPLFAYSSCNDRSAGALLAQKGQVSVNQRTRTTLPLRFSRVSGSELSQASNWNGGAATPMRSSPAERFISFKLVRSSAILASASLSDMPLFM
jgi:hypothetical protein